MSEEREEKNQKLKLSRDTAPQEPKASKTDQTLPSADDSQPLPEPIEDEASGQKLKLSSLSLPEGDLEKQTPLSDSPLPHQGPSEPKKPTTAAATPPPLPTIAETKQGDYPMVSILVIVGLFLVLSGAGLGIWWVLSQPSADDGEPEITSNSSTQRSTTGATIEPSNDSSPISRAKAVIAELPSSEVDEIIARVEPTPTAIEASENSPVSPQMTAEKMEAELHLKTRKIVISYLSKLHIEGVRSGNSPKVMIAGESYLTGDEVVKATGLTFEGLNNGKLQFKDRNGIYYLKSF